MIHRGPHSIISCRIPGRNSAERSLKYNFETKRFISLFLVDGNMLKKTDQDVLRKSLASNSFGKLNTEGGMLKGK